MTHAERQPSFACSVARYRTKQAEGAPTLRYRNPQITAAGFSGGATSSSGYRNFRAIIRLGSTPCRKTCRAAAQPICNLDLSELESIVPPRAFGHD
jgi:hypothetical protein